MIKKHIKYIASAVATACIFSSCINLEELNIDPNNSTTTQPSLLLTGIAYSAFNQSSTSPAYALKQLVQTDGESSEQVYKWTRGDFDLYGNLRDVTKLDEMSEDGTAYQALVHFFRAHYFYQLTMDFGDIPYSEALKGESESLYQPKYDSQEKVFEGILNELATADNILATSTDKIEGDIIFNGDLQKWRKLVNAYRLRILMTLSKKNKVGSIDIKSTFANIVKNSPLMESSEDNGQLVYKDQTDNRYPHFNSSSFGSGMYMDSTYIAALAIRKDPRLFAIATRTPAAEKAGKPVNDFTAYDGGDPAVPYSIVNDKATKLGMCSKPLERYYQAPTNEPTIIMGYTEQQLILAEAVVRGWISGDDKSYYESAVKASFEFYKEYSPSTSVYLSEEEAEKYLLGEEVAYDSSLTEENKIELIAMQKYLPTFLQGSLWLAYYDALRTGYPEFRRADGVDLLYRWMYPQDEYNNNPVNVTDAINAQFDGDDSAAKKSWWLQ